MFHIIIICIIVLIGFIADYIFGARTENLPIRGGADDHVIMGRVSRPEPAPTEVGETIIFDDHPEFTPNLTPRQIFQLGSFGGTYWRPIHSSVTGKDYKDQHLEFAKWWDGIPEDMLTQPIQDKTKNKYGVLSGTTLEFWENNGWMREQDPYGWVQWYCRFYAGRRSDDDKRQIDRWKAFAGPRGRFRVRLINMCLARDGAIDDVTISPVIRQGLQHWAYILVKRDMVKTTEK